MKTKMKKEELSGYELICKESIMDEICENVTEGHLRNTLLINELEKKINNYSIITDKDKMFRDILRDFKVYENNIITEDHYNMEQEEIIERQEKINELKEYMNHYEEINEKDEIIKDLGDGEIINEHVWDCYDCGMGYSELIGECVYLRKSINKIKKLVKEIC
jgi:hypothetical protein